MTRGSDALPAVSAFEGTRCDSSSVQRTTYNLAVMNSSLARVNCHAGRAHSTCTRGGHPGRRGTGTDTDTACTWSTHSMGCAEDKTTRAGKTNLHLSLMVLVPGFRM